MKTKKKSNRANSVAGEYYVAAELLRRGFNASVTVGNAKAVDILASHGNGGSPISIQVKTTQSKSSNGKIKWMLHASDEKHNPAKFYTFVQLREEGEHPHFYIVPSKVVAEYAKKTHRNFMKGRRRDGKPRANGTMRKYEVFDETYRDQWKTLRLRSIA